jgi:hypothetical protein
MSQAFRPVKEIWNIHSSCFIESEKLIALLYDLAARAGTASEEHAYGDKAAVWFEDGRKILNYVEWDQRFNPASFKDSLEEQGVLIDTNEVAALLSNMRSLARQWRESLGEHGELTFYVDVC